MVGTNTSGPRKAAAAKTGHPKTSKKATAKRTGEIVSLSARRKVPGLPHGRDFLTSTLTAWADFWKSPVAGTVCPESDMPALVRLFSIVDEIVRCQRDFSDERIVSGSKGQAIINPLGPFMLALAREARALEDRFGMNVVSRLRLSIDLNTAANSLDAMNKRLAADDGNDDEAEGEEDPRSRFPGAVDTTATPT